MFGKLLSGTPLKWRQRQRLNTVLGVTFVACTVINLVLLVWPLDGGSLLQQHAPSSHAVLNLSVDSSAIASPVQARQAGSQAEPILNGVPVILKNKSLPQVMLPPDAFSKRKDDEQKQYERKEASGDVEKPGAGKPQGGGGLLGGTRSIQEGGGTQPLAKQYKPQSSGRVMDDDTADDDFVGPVRLAPPSLDSLLSGLSEQQKKIELAERAAAPDKPAAKIEQQAKLPSPPAGESCELYLETVDAYSYARDYAKQPLLIERKGPETKLQGCGVACQFASGVAGPYDASLEEKTAWPRVRNLTALSGGKLQEAIKSSGADDVIMAQDLKAHVPTLPLSWADGGLMRSPVPSAKKEDLIAAFLPPCKTGSLAEEVLSAMLKSDGVAVKSYGQCLPNQAKGPVASEVLPHVKFALVSAEGADKQGVMQAFFQAFSAGTVPIVIGAADIKELAPSPWSLLSVSSAAAVPSLVQQVQRLLKNDSAYDALLAYKHEGPSDAFLALMDDATSPADCRLCTLLADRQRAQERTDKPRDRPCACRDSAKGAERVVHHLYFRERGSFEYRSLFLEEPLTLARMNDTVRFTLGSDHKPLWTGMRPSYRRHSDDGTWDTSHHPLRLHKLQPVGRAEGLESDEAVAEWVRGHPCGELEVVLV